jgi:ribosomal protein S18 acetylase RimI-like enzyme
MNDAFERAVAFQRELDRRRAEVTIRATHGTAHLTPSLPRVYDLNAFVVDRGTSAGAEELIAEADPILGSHGLAHRKITIDDDLGRGVEPGFRNAGWQIVEHVVMPHVRPAPALDLARVEEIDPEELVPVWHAGMGREDLDADTVDQLVRAQLARREHTHVRYFATRVDGRPASYCELFSDGATGQIESVMTDPELRGRGLGRLVVAGALAASKAVHDFTFLVADANDWPKELYRKLGFEDAGTMYRFLLPARP